MTTSWGDIVCFSSKNVPRHCSCTPPPLLYGGCYTARAPTKLCRRPYNEICCVFLHFGAIFDWTRGKFGFLRNYFSVFLLPLSHAVKLFKDFWNAWPSERDGGVWRAYCALRSACRLHDFWVFVWKRCRSGARGEKKQSLLGLCLHDDNERLFISTRANQQFLTIIFVLSVLF